MSDCSGQKASRGEMYRGFGDVDALFVIAPEATPSCHPAEGWFDYATPRQHVESWLVVDPADDLDDEIKKSGFVYELGTIAGTSGETGLAFSICRII